MLFFFFLFYIIFFLFKYSYYYINTNNNRKILGKIEKDYKKKFLKEFQNPGKVYEGPDVYIPFKGKSFKVDEIAEFADFKVEKVD